jgi:hypothetical protein
VLRNLLQALRYGTSGSEGLGGAWVALSALRLQCLEGQAALDAAAAGLAWLRARQEVPPGDCAPVRFQCRSRLRIKPFISKSGSAGHASIGRCM